MKELKTDNPSSREKFVSLTNKRVGNATKYISLIGNLSDRSSYSYTEQDAKKIFLHLRKSLKESEARFFSNDSKENNSFKLVH